MKRWWLIGIAVVVLAGIVLANLKGSGRPSVKARTSEVERGTVTSVISAPGHVRAVASVDISAEVPGRVVELRIAEGDSINAGELLLRLDDAQYRSRVDQARASLRSTRANLALGEARLEKFQKDKNRTLALEAKDLASAEAVERVVTDYNVQEAEVRARREDVSRMRAALEDAEDNLAKTVYRAPVSGIISRLNVEEGEIVITGTMNNPGTVILTIADLSRMEVETEVDETDVVKVLPGQDAEISVDAIPDTTFSGTVVTVGNSGRRKGGGTDEVINFEVKVRFDDSEPRLKPGMTADVEVETETREGVLTVPIQALVARSRGRIEDDRRQGEKKSRRAEKAPADTLSGEEREKWRKEVLEGVYKVVDDAAVFVELETGIADENRIEVEGEIVEGDKLVSGPYRVLRDLKEKTKIKTSGTKDGDGDAD